MPEIDWKQLQQDATDVVIPDGDYVCIVIKSDATESSNGKPMLKLQLAVVEGPKKDRKLFTQIVLTADNPFALQRWFSNLAAFGLDHGYFGRSPSMSQIATDLMNRGVIATVGHGEYQGTNRNTVDAYKPYVPTGPVPPGMIIGAPTGGPVASTPAVSAGPVPPSAPSTPSAPPVPSTPPATAPPARPF